jgi:glycosyltransferase involved in cell wall biosynthesis
MVGWGATVREIDQLSTLFDSVVHVAPLYPGRAPETAIPYERSQVQLRAFKPAGGEKLSQKLRIVLCYPSYARLIWQELKTADVVHVRAPANISMLALLILGAVRKPSKRWVKYAGDWARGGGEPWSYKFQRWFLRRNLHGGVVTVNGRFPDQPEHVHSFLNPCLTQSEIAGGSAALGGKRLLQPLRLLFVGRLESSKGAGVCLEVLRHLRDGGLDAELELIGDGPERSKIEQQAQEWKLASKIALHGGLPRSALGQFYSRAHFILLPSKTEGWPKVLSEAMAYGAVPIASAVGTIPEYLQAFGTGQTLGSTDAKQFSEGIQTYVRDPDLWQKHAWNAARAAKSFSYDCYLGEVTRLLGLPKQGREI